MRWIYLIYILLLPATTLAYTGGNVESGKTKSATCIACHGADGNASTNIVWPKIAGQHAQYLSKELLDFKLGSKGGRNNPVMQSIVMSLNDDDIADLAAYYENLPRTIGAAKPDLVVLGQQLYRGGNMTKGIPACAACHSPDGLGNGPAVFPLLSGQHPAYIADQLKAFRSGLRSNDLNHMMRDIAAKMNDQEIDAVASYISGLHEPLQ